MSKHFDVVVVGAGLGALSCAALLARRSWRVLVLGHGYRPAIYTLDSLPLARRPHTFLVDRSPAWGRILTELAQSQTFRRRVRALDPMIGFLFPKRTFEIPPDPHWFTREIEREFPEVRRVIDQLYAELARVSEVADGILAQDLPLPPGTFWERRESNRPVALLPHLSEGAKLLAEFPREHPYLRIVETSARFASDLAPPLPPFALARLHAAWTRGVSEVIGGEDDLTAFLVERVLAHGGEAHLGDRVSEILTRRGKTAFVRTEADRELTGVQFVVTDQPGAELLELASDYRVKRSALDERPRTFVDSRRFVVSLLVRDEGLPKSLPRETFLFRDPEAPVHLQQYPARGFGVSSSGGSLPPPSGMTLLVAETVVAAPSAHRTDDLDQARRGVLGTIEAYLPFVERHYVLVDSVHDGLPIWDYRSGKRKLVERASARAGGASPEAEPMVPVLSVEPAQFHGLAGEPTRMLLPGAFGVGRTVLPALGQEGELIAAWTVARTITRTDRRKEKMRREMWSKVELG